MNSAIWYWNKIRYNSYLSGIKLHCLMYFQKWWIIEYLLGNARNHVYGLFSFAFANLSLFGFLLFFLYFDFWKWFCTGDDFLFASGSGILFFSCFVVCISILISWEYLQIFLAKLIFQSIAFLIRLIINLSLVLGSKFFGEKAYLHNIVLKMRMKKYHLSEVKGNRCGTSIWQI